MLTALPDTFFRENAPTPTHVTGDIPCVECGYNLRTLGVYSRCPECGRPVAYTLAFLRSRWAASWNAVRELAQLIGFGLALFLVVVGVGLVEQRLGFATSAVEVLACLLFVAVPLFVLCSLAMIVFIRDVAVIRYQWYKLVPIIIAIAVLAIGMNSLPRALSRVVILGVMFGLPAWSALHIVQLGESIGDRRIATLAMYNAWLGRSAFWLAFVQILAGGNVLLWCVATIGVALYLLHVVVLWLTAARLSGIVQAVRATQW